MRRRLVAAGLVVLAVAATVACGNDEDKVTIGAFNFSESAILANIYAKALRDAGEKVTVRPNLGNREVVEPAIEKGEIDLYPGYVATELTFLKGEPSPDLDATAGQLRQRFGPKGVSVLTPSPAIDTNAYAVTKATADKFSLKRLSDVAPVGDQLTLGGPPECPTRPYCQPGLEKTYGIKFKDFKSLDAGGPITKAALEKGDIDMGLIFSSDGAIAAKGFVVLEDDKHLQNADNVVPVIRTKALSNTIRDALNAVSAKLTTEQLVEMNKRADVDKEDPEKLAGEWVDKYLKP